MFDGKASKLIVYADDVAIIACQRSAQLGTSPTDALNTLLNFPSIDIYMEYLAAKSAATLTALGDFKFRPWGHSSIGRHCSDKTD